MPITFCATGANSSNSVAELLKATITVSASTFLNTLRRVLVPFGCLEHYSPIAESGDQKAGRSNPPKEPDRPMLGCLLLP